MMMPGTAPKHHSTGLSMLVDDRVVTDGCSPAAIDLDAVIVRVCATTHVVDVVVHDQAWPIDIDAIIVAGKVIAAERTRAGDAVDRTNDVTEFNHRTCVAVRDQDAVPPTFIDDLAVANRDIVRLNPQRSMNLEAADDGSRRRDRHVADLPERYAIADARAVGVWKTYKGRGGGQRHEKIPLLP